MIHFRNQLSQNNRYFPRSFENILSNKLENKNNEEALTKTNKNMQILKSIEAIISLI